MIVFPHPQAFITRQPYFNASGVVVQHKRISRQIGNEPLLLERLRSDPKVQVTVVEFSRYSYKEQLQLVAQHDVLIGMHGAGMTHLLWLPPWAGVVELWPRTSTRLDVMRVGTEKKNHTEGGHMCISMR
jgi:capsular polysaccharide biosynthesis protein